MQKTLSARYPGLKKLKLALELRTEPQSKGSFSSLCLAFCSFADSDLNPDEEINLLIDSLASYLENSTSTYHDFQELAPFLADYGISLANLLADLAELSLRLDLGDRLSKVYENLAKLSRDPQCNFLAGWLQLNMDNIHDCISICSSVSESFGPIKSLLGQALIEAERYEEAIKALEEAVRISADDLLSWFMLSKAQLAHGNVDAAWECNQQALTISPEHDELIVLSAAIAIESNSIAKNQEAWSQLYPIWRQNRGHGLLTGYLFQLAFHINEPQLTEEITSDADWSMLVDDQNFMESLGLILREFHRKEWSQESLLFIDKITAQIGLPANR